MGEVMDALAEADEVMGGQRAADTPPEEDFEFVDSWLRERDIDPEDFIHAAIHDATAGTAGTGLPTEVLAPAVMSGMVTGILLMERRNR